MAKEQLQAGLRCLGKGRNGAGGSTTRLKQIGELAGVFVVVVGRWSGDAVVETAGRMGNRKGLLSST